MVNNKLSDAQVSSLLDSLADHDRYVFLDTAEIDEDNQQSLLFTQPVKQLQFRQGEDRDEYYGQLTRCMDEGYYLAGWFAYEFLHAPHDDTESYRDNLLADFGAYRAPKVFEHRSGADKYSVPERELSLNGSYRLANLQPNLDQEDYCQAITTILDYIAAGDTYQVNYTFKFFFDFVGSITAFYQDLRHSQPVPYGCCIRNGEDYILSFSPELFFRINNEEIVARPMKGTMKRGRTVPEDLRHATFLQSDVKNRSENVMIVDLLRNDLSRLVDATGGGTVKVDSLFDIERYRSVFQMTSSIVAKRNNSSRMQISEVLNSLFPCGSVTGAPKIRTMEIIDELEKEPRGVYTGAIGYFAPDRRAIFNVPIRTVVLRGMQGEMGIGSGIVADSSPETEWQECLLKARFLTSPLPKFDLIETALYHPEKGVIYLADHLDRLQDSAHYFNFSFNRARIETDLQHYLSGLKHRDYSRIRLTLSGNGELHISSSSCARPGAFELPENPSEYHVKPVLIDFADQKIDASKPWFFHKTTMRQLYDQAFEKARSMGLFDVVFCNGRDEITEGCITNIFIVKDGCYFTPPRMCGLLDGIMRKQLLSVDRPFQPRERMLYKEDIIQAEHIFVCNSVRGVLPAQLQKD